jgi:FkbM family methyltransferase
VKKLTLKNQIASMLDVGSNIGGYSVVLGKKIRVVAMEPMPNTYALLTLNITLNRANVKALRAAAYDGSCATVKLCRSPNHSGGDSVCPEGNIEAPAYTLDDICDKYGPFDLIKIDVEGSEDRVLKGLSQLPKYLILEIRPKTWPFVKKFLIDNRIRILMIERLIRGYAYNIIANK